MDQKSDMYSRAYSIVFYTKFDMKTWSLVHITKPKQSQVDSEKEGKRIITVILRRTSCPFSVLSHKMKT